MKDQQKNQDHNAQNEDGQQQGVSRRKIFQAGLGSAALVALGAVDPKQAIAADLGDRALVLKVPNLRRNVDTFFKRLGDNARLRERFIHNPAQILVNHFLPEHERITTQAVSDANRFLFSALANDQFRNWAENYQANLLVDMRSGKAGAKQVDKAKIFQDTAKALGQFGDENLLFSLLNAQGNAGEIDAEGQVRSIVAVEIAILAIAVAVWHLIVTQIDFTPIADPQDGPAAVSLSSAELRNLSEELVRRARHISESGELSNPEARL